MYKAIKLILLTLSIFAARSNLLSMEYLQIPKNEDPASYIMFTEERKIETKSYILRNNNNYQVIIEEDIIKNIIPLLKMTFRPYPIQDNDGSNEIRLSLSNEDLALLAEVLSVLNKIVNHSCNHECYRHNNKQELLEDICTELEEQTLKNKDEIKKLANVFLSSIEQFQLSAYHIRNIRIPKYEIIQYLNEEYSGHLPTKDVDKILSLNVILTLPYLLWSFISSGNNCYNIDSDNRVLNCVEMPFMALLTLASMLYILKVGCKINGNRKKNVKISG